MTTIGAARQDPSKIDLIPYLARARDLESRRESRKQNYRIESSLNASSHLWGSCGELMISDMFGMSVDESDELDAGYDFRLPDGRTLDTKTSLYHRSPDLKLPCDSKKLADLYVLVSIDQGSLTGEVVGWATLEELRQGERKTYGKDRRYKENFVLTRGQLHPMTDLRVN